MPPLREYSPYEDDLYSGLHSELLDAIQTVVRADKMAARKAHKICPHLRLKDLNNIKNDDIGSYSVRRLANIAAGLGIKVRAFSLELPTTMVG